MKYLIAQGQPKTIKIQIALEIKLNNWKNILDQIGHALKKMMKEIVQEIFTQAIIQIFQMIKKENTQIRLYKEKKREILTLMGKIKIPDFEVRFNGEYYGRSNNLILGLKEKEHLLESTKIFLRSILSKMSYRESAKTLALIWGKASYQNLHNFIIKSPEEQNYFVRIREKISGYIKSRKIFYLDGNVIKVRYCKKAKVVKETVRIVLKETFNKGSQIIQLTYGFLENSYEKLINKLICKGEDLSKTVAIADGERIIEEAVKRTEIKGFQRCLWHFLENFRTKLKSENVPEKGAENMTNEMRRICYIRKTQLKNMYTSWQKVIGERTKILEDYVEAFRNDNKIKSAEYLQRAIPNLFTYVRWFCSYNKRIWTGRTVNKLERLNRRISFRMKRVGAVWSPKGAKKMLSLIFSDYYNYSYAAVRPAEFSLKKSVVII